MAAKTVAERFNEKVDRSGGPEACWPWTAATNRWGYGRLRVGGSHQSAHRIAWTLAAGANPGDLSVLHRCDNPPCCNPAHLFLGTQSDNLADMTRKGRRVTNGAPIGLLAGEANPNSVLSRYGARIVCRMATSGKWEQKEIAAAFRISQQQVSKIRLGRRWASATADIRGVPVTANGWGEAYET